MMVAAIALQGCSPSPTNVGNDPAGSNDNQQSGQWVQECKWVTRADPINPGESAGEYLARDHDHQEEICKNVWKSS